MVLMNKMSYCVARVLVLWFQLLQENKLKTASLLPNIYRIIIIYVYVSLLARLIKMKNLKNGMIDSLLYAKIIAIEHLSPSMYFL